jgi:hypothetical protein
MIERDGNCVMGVIFATSSGRVPGGQARVNRNIFPGRVIRIRKSVPCTYAVTSVSTPFSIVTFVCVARRPCSTSALV